VEILQQNSQTLFPVLSFSQHVLDVITFFSLLKPLSPSFFPCLIQGFQLTCSNFLAGLHKLSPFKVKTPNQTYLVGALEDGNVGSEGNEGEVTIRC
jgi:hypothetical protein